MEASGRPNQKMRTRKDLLQAAARLMTQGKMPSLEDIAEEALVSRATAYRYFPSVEALLMEAALDIAMPAPESLFKDDSKTDPVERLQRADTAMHDQILAHELALRLFLANALERSTKPDTGEDAPPLRQNRRSPLIEAALAPAKKQFSAKGYDKLTKALALVLGTEALIVCKDVLHLDDKETRAVKAWAVAALVESARKTKAA